VYNKRKFGQHYHADLKLLVKKLLVAKKKAQETFLLPVLQNLGSCWTELYKYVKRRKGNRENIPAIKDHNGKLIRANKKGQRAKTPIMRIFTFKCTNPQIQSTDPCKPFAVSINNIRNRLSAIGRKKSVGPDGIPGEVLKLSGEAMIPYVARFLDITMNNNAIPGD
jgi:hypothetical protein